MQYKLYVDSIQDAKNILETVLNNRGISNPRQYLNLSEETIHSYSDLDNINDAIDMFDKHFSNKNKIGILIDPDVDGFTSSAIIYSYILKMYENYPLVYIIHKKAKVHGLSHVDIPEDIKLLIIPDASTNDTEQCKKLKENGIDILILDHHERERDNPYAVIVNNQISDNYPNKDLSGVGIVYQFLRALDDYYWQEYANDYLDLVALGNIGDMEDVRTYETKYLIDKGLKNVKNKCLLALIKSQEYSMKGIINIKNIQWSIVPVINAMCRIGSIEEQELMFKAFIEQDEYFDYTTKGSKDKPSEAIQESIYDRVARLCKNVKQRQDKQKVKGTEALYDIVINECSNDKIIIVDATEYLDDSLSGVTAMNIASIFRKPCLLLFKRLSEGTEIEIYGGSARNCNNSPIKNLKDVIQSCKIFNLAQGHGNAFGIELDIDKMQLAKDTLNNILKDVVYDTAYTVDFILSTDELDYSLIYEIDKLSDMIGQGIEEVLIAIENVSITKDNITILGKNNNTISFYINDIKLIQFNCKNGTTLFDWFNDWGSNNTVTINIVGKPKIDLYNNVKTTQVEIVDVEIISSENKEEIENEDVVW